MTAELLTSCEDAFAEARSSYLAFTDIDRTDETGRICRWLADNSHRAYDIFASGSDASGMDHDLLKIVGMFHSIHHALVDDGEISFVVTEFYGPRIIFGDIREAQMRDLLPELFKRQMDLTNMVPMAGRFVKGLDGFEAFVVAFEAHHEEQERRRNAFEQEASKFRYAMAKKKDEGL